MSDSMSSFDFTILANGSQCGDGECAVPSGFTAPAMDAGSFDFPDGDSC
jgi:hypothetical protein